MFYLDLFNALDRHHVDYLLIGGMAASLHGVERATLDADITVAANPENLAHLIEAAEELRLSPVLPVPLEAFCNLQLLRQWHTELNLGTFALRTSDLADARVDVLMFPPVEFSGMSQRATLFDVAGTTIRVASIDDLIALKQAFGRPIDHSDIAHLQRIQQPSAH